MTTRRGFFGMMAGATAATFVSRFPLLPAPQPELPPFAYGDDLVAEVRAATTKPAAFEVGLLRVCTDEVQRELRAWGYCRVAPGRIHEHPRQTEILATFPMVTHGRWRTRGVGLFVPDGELLFYSPWTDSGGWPIDIDLVANNTIQTTVNISWGLENTMDSARALKLQQVLGHTA